jgi:exodeoxyribonuclease VII large subunit
MSATPLFDCMPEAPPVLTVSELTAQVQAIIEHAFSAVWVAGEISSLKNHSSGHVYFNLKDAGATIRAVLWRSAAQRLKLTLQEGMDVVIRGRLGVYPQRGDYQLYVDSVQLKGAGAQDLALRLLKEKLAKLGYFAAERKKPLPRFPRRIAIITSPTGAAVRDMLQKLAERWAAAEVMICPARVQGPTAPAEIVEALRRVNRLADVDVILLGRGGGSSDDLSAFNTEMVAHAIFQCRIPLISAVGHEIDVTLADLVADCRALTPTDAVIRATPDGAELLEGLHECRQRLVNVLRGRMQAIEKQLASVMERRVFACPLERLRERERRLDEMEERMGRAIVQRLTLARQRTVSDAARLQALSPLNVLARGYSLTRTEDGRHVVRSASQVNAGDHVEVLLGDGRLLVGIEKILPALERLTLPMKS